MKQDASHPGRPAALHAVADMDAPPRIYRLKVTLDDLHPPVWRRLEVPADFPIEFVDAAVRTVFNWSCLHASQFLIKGRRYGTPSDWYLDREALYEEERCRIERKGLPRRQEQEQLKQLSLDVFGRDIFNPDDGPDSDEGASREDEEQIPLLCELVSRVRTKFRYCYDFGDCWDLTVEVEKIESAQAGVKYPRCTDGARADPIEDWGGAWSYAEFIAAAGDPQHPRRARLVEWMGPDWDPETFSVDQVNARLRKTFPDS